MNTSNRGRLLWIVGGLIVVAIVAVLAYSVGLHSSSGVFVGPFGRGMMAGYDGWGFLGSILFILLVVGLLGLLFSPPSGYRGSYRPPVGPAEPSGVDQLKELADLHDRGKLTDEEFQAAKRRLLGL